VQEGGGETGTFFFWKCFFHRGQAREGKGVIFLQIHYGTKERVQADFFFFFFIFGGGGGEG